MPRQPHRLSPGEGSWSHSQDRVDPDGWLVQGSPWSPRSKDVLGLIHVVKIVGGCCGSNPALPPPCCVALGKLPNLSVPVSSSVNMALRMTRAVVRLMR